MWSDEWLWLYVSAFCFATSVGLILFYWTKITVGMRFVRAVFQLLRKIREMAHVQQNTTFIVSTLELNKESDSSDGEDEGIPLPRKCNMFG